MALNSSSNSYKKVTYAAAIAVLRTWQSAVIFLYDAPQNTNRFSHSFELVCSIFKILSSCIAYLKSPLNFSLPVRDFPACKVFPCIH